MTLLYENEIQPPPMRRRVRRRSPIVGLWAFVVAAVILMVMSFLPTSYVVEQPGPVFDTLGTAEDADGNEVPVIDVEGAEVYPTEGSLDLLTVQIWGNRESTPSWFQLARAWADPRRSVVPIDLIFPEGVTADQRSEQNAALMVDSQQEATAAALTQLDVDYTADLQVLSLTEDSASEGILEPGDVVAAANGTSIPNVNVLREVINEAAGDPVSIDIVRDGVPQTVSVTPDELEGESGPVWVAGISVTMSYEFPLEVTIQLQDVGGPSAGMMFSLGIIDTLTPGFLQGGEEVAGTGTIDAGGTVGPIGGIRQKLWGASDAGAEWFLAPSSNCDEVVDHVPPGMNVFSVSTLDEAVTVLETIEGGDEKALADLATCSP